MTAGWARQAGAAILAVAMAVAAGPSGAGAVIGPAVRVNAEVVTSYELDQRIALMMALNQQGDVPKLARQSLIDDRLRHAAAVAMNVTVSDVDLNQGMTDFAARGKLSLDQLLQYLAQHQVDPAALRDFVKVQIEWRGAVRAKFVGKINVSPAEIDRAIDAGVAAGGELQVLVSEIFLPDGTDQGDPAVLAERIIAGSHSLNSFQVYAQKFSKDDAATNGGMQDWQPLSALPPGVGAAVQALKVGEMTKPLPVPGGVGLYWLRDESEGPGTGKPSYQVEYLTLTYPAGQEAALTSMAGKLMRCGDIYPMVRGLPEDAVQRQTVPERGLPADLAGPLAHMDAGETVVRATPAGTQLLMLCDRTPITAVPPSRDAVKNQLLNRKIAILAEGWMEQMRSDAIITDY